MVMGEEAEGLETVGLMRYRLNGSIATMAILANMSELFYGTHGLYAAGISRKSTTDDNAIGEAGVEDAIRAYLGTQSSLCNIDSQRLHARRTGRKHENAPSNELQELLFRYCWDRHWEISYSAREYSLSHGEFDMLQVSQAQGLFFYRKLTCTLPRRICCAS